MSNYAKYAETSGLIEASPKLIYEFLDDQANRRRICASRLA